LAVGSPAAKKKAVGAKQFITYLNDLPAFFAEAEQGIKGHSTQEVPHGHASSARPLDFKQFQRPCTASNH
jgi:hypothetical protein